MLFHCPRREDTETGQGVAAIAARNAEKNGVDKPTDSGILSSIKRKADGTYEVVNHEITEEAIQAVPLVKPEGWTDELAEKLREAHKDLLRFVKDAPAETEAAAVYTPEMKLLDRRIGGKNAVLFPRLNVPHILIHNHPDGLTFSPTDIYSFIRRDSTVLMTAVGNDSAVYLLQKTIKYKPLEYEDAFNRLPLKLQQYVEANDPEGYVNELIRFMKEGDQYGVFFDTRTGS